METESTEVTSIQRRNDIGKSTSRTHDISSILKAESTSKFPHRINVIVSTWIRISKSMKFRRTFHVEFQHRADGELTKMCSLGCAYAACEIQNLLARVISTYNTMDQCILLLEVVSMIPVRLIHMVEILTSS